MRRRTSIVVTAVACFAFAVVAPAYSQAPIIVTDITFSEEGAFGTFTATAPLCPSGMFVDEFVAGGGFQSGRVFAATVRKTLTCADGSGTFTILFHPQETTATPAGRDRSRSWAEPTITPSSVATVTSAWCCSQANASAKPSPERSICAETD